MIASRALDRTFVDTDRYIASTEGEPLEKIVKGKGWSAFRSKEANALRDLLHRHPYDSIIACGGGIVESSESRKILKTSKSSFPVICVLREKDAIRHFIENQARAIYGEDLKDLIRRREPLFEECASHFFFNLTCPEDLIQTRLNDSAPVHPLKFKQVGDAFLRLLSRILGDPRSPQIALTDTARRPFHTRSNIFHVLSSHGPGPDREGSTRRNSTALPEEGAAMVHHPVLPRRANVADRASLLTRRTTAVSLTYPDLCVIEPTLLKEISQGVDALEVRIDMLDCVKPLTKAAREAHPDIPPSFDAFELMRQVETLRRQVPEIPILFTVRSTREGGYFFDDRKLSAHETASAFSQAIYFHLLGLAVGMGVELLDVELGWDPLLTRKIIESRGSTKTVASYHDMTGALKWDTALPMQLYDRARSFGSGVHIVQMIGITSQSTVEQNAHVASCNAKIISNSAVDASFRLPPIMAFNTSSAGRASRPFNDVLNFVSHPSMATKGGRGQLSLQELMETLVRLNLVSGLSFHVFSDKTSTLDSVKMVICAAFEEFGLPYVLSEAPSQTPIHHFLVDQSLLSNDSKANDSVSDGVYLPNATVVQQDLFESMLHNNVSRLTWPARVVRAVDILAREDTAPALLGTEQARHPPNALGELKGPLIGCHTLPSAIYRVMGSHLAPINAPGSNRKALVVVLRDEGETETIAMTAIAKRAAVFAMFKLGFGTVQVLSESEQRQDDTWTEDLLQLYQQSPKDVLDPRTDRSAISPKLPDMPLPNLVHISPHQLTLHGSEKQNDLDSPRAVQADMDMNGDVTEQVCAVVVVGGTEHSQRTCLQTLQSPRSSLSDHDTESDGDALVLPKEMWNTLFGGTILRLPSKRQSPWGVALHDEQDLTWESGGWIHVAPHVVERSAVERTVVEAWTRRAAPMQRIQQVWQYTSKASIP